MRQRSNYLVFWWPHFIEHSLCSWQRNHISLLIYRTALFRILRQHCTRQLPQELKNNPNITLLEILDLSRNKIKNLITCNNFEAILILNKIKFLSHDFYNLFKWIGLENYIFNFIQIYRNTFAVLSHGIDCVTDSEEHYV